MRRHILLLVLLLSGVTALVSAQETELPLEEAVTVPKDPASPRVFGPVDEVWVPVELEETEPPINPLPATPQDHAADECANAPDLPLSDGRGGDQTTVNDMSNSPGDPVLGCVWGRPQDPRGFRTVWYKFVAPASGRLTVLTDFNPSTYEDSYDTVLALYRSTDGTCGTLTQVGCNDDANGFHSQITSFITQGLTYYIEVADWQFAAEDAATLRLAVVLDEGETFWNGDVPPIAFPRTRHVVVTDGRYLYVIAGETAVVPFPHRDANTVRFNPEANAWEKLYPMPGPDSHGYSRTTGAYLDGRIYIPAGYVGNDDSYDGTHWVYDIATNSWFTTLAAPWPNGQPYAWSWAVSSPANNGYFLTGGLLSGDPDPSFPSDAEPTGRLLFFTPGGNGVPPFWNPNLPDMSRARYAHVAALLETPQGRKVCVAGGISKSAPDQATVLRSAECYDISSGTWAPIASLNFGRFSAGSAVGPDGRWYVFAGGNANLEPVTVTEVYDPATNTWEVLDSRYSVRNPGRVWVRGAFIGDTLWIVGGETIPGSLVVPLVQSLFLPHRDLFLPFLRKPRVSVEPNNVFAEAEPLEIGVPEQHDFAGQEDFWDIYRFQVVNPGVYDIIVSSIPPNHDYDIYAYNANKYLVGDGLTVGNRDEVARTLPLVPGTYYAMVLRAFGQPTTDKYTIEVVGPLPGE